MSQKRHADRAAAQPGLSVRTLALTYPNGFHQPPHSHDWPQLVYAASGVLTVSTAAGAWVVPPQRAVWVPAGTRHQLDTTGETALRTLYLHPRVAPALAASCAVVHITPLVRELVLHIVAAGPLESDRPEHARLLAVLIDQLKTLDQAPLSVPLPRDPRARRVAERVLARASQADTLDELAVGSGASARTLERLFRAETGLPFGRWRQQARLLGALRLLGEGLAVTAVAARVGYRSPSAFVAMFTRALGRSPGRYFESSASG
jgi:AraC-like DNA-binding protein/quercetin dioxygenase-like cupin family protein